jgi:hypothetical protein
MALQLREQTVITMQWIANRLQMGTRTHQPSASLPSLRQKRE